MGKKRILSGMRPTGAMHIGHYFGALKNWVPLQDTYETFYMVADWHAMTTAYDETRNISQNTTQMLKDWLACGISPQKSVIFRQSDVPEHTELFLILSMITPLGWLLRCPTYKEQLREIKNHDINTYGFLGYPVLQAADILIYKAEVVPVGEDQVSHLELTREIARRFNSLYGKFFPEPQAILTKSPKLLGFDGRKMSKSYGNAMNLADDEKTILKKIKQMITDPSRVHASDKGHPEVCSVYQYWKVLNEKETEIAALCREAKIGCVECKKRLALKISEFLKPLQEERKKITESQIKEILDEGKEKARAVAKETISEIREILKI